LLRLEADLGGGAGGSGTSVERFAASSVEDGVSVGCAGGGCRRPITGLREPQPEKQTQRTQSTQSSRRKEEAERGDRRPPQRMAEFTGHDWAGIGSAEILNGLLAS